MFFTAFVNWQIGKSTILKSEFKKRHLTNIYINQLRKQLFLSGAEARWNGTENARRRVCGEDNGKTTR